VIIYQINAVVIKQSYFTLKCLELGCVGMDCLPDFSCKKVENWCFN